MYEIRKPDFGKWQVIDNGRVVAEVPDKESAVAIVARALTPNVNIQPGEQRRDVGRPVSPRVC